MAELLADTRIRNYPNTSTSYVAGSNNNNSNHSGTNGQVPQMGMMSAPNGFRNHASYSSMQVNGPPPLLPLMSPYGNQAVAYGMQTMQTMQTMQPNQYMVNFWNIFCKSC